MDGLNASNWESPAVFKSLHAGGVTASNATIATWENYRETLDNIAAWFPRFSEHRDILVQVRTVEDILQAKKDGKAGVILGFQNASPIENHLDRLALFHTLGVRIVQVTCHEGNLLGSVCYERHDYGLTNFGVDAVREMNRLGILIDLSHVGVQTTLEAIELSEKPVAVTHANAKPYRPVAESSSGADGPRLHPRRHHQDPWRQLPPTLQGSLVNDAGPLTKVGWGLAADGDR